MTRLTIDPRFCGPPGIGQGGFVAGLLAEALGGSDVTVSLRAPAPLGRPLEMRSSDDHVRLHDGETLVAEARRATLDLTVPAPPSMGEAVAASARFDRDGHLYPGCFVCGPAREAGDGWRIFPGPLGEGRVAAPWTADGEGDLSPHLVWAALDCPGYFAVQEAAGRALLAQMTARILAPVPTGAPLIIQGWSLGSEGRKHRAATAIHAEDGALLAVAGQLWISLAGNTR